MSTPSTRRRGRPAGGEHVVDRERLLDAAERVIARDGRGASLEAVAVEAGVTKPVVYQRIGSRAALSDALAERLAERLMITAGSQLLGGIDDHATLTAFLRTTLETIAEHRELFLFVTRGAADDAAERTLYLAGISARPLAALLAAQRGDTDPTTTAPWAYAIVGMLNMVSLWWIEEGDRPVDELAMQLADLLWPALRPTGHPPR